MINAASCSIITTRE